MKPNDSDVLTKKTSEELQEILNRYESLLKNRKVLENLVDKGESIKKAREKVLDEIKLRESMQGLEHSFSTFSIDKKKSANEFLKEKHVQHICQLDKPFEDSRYRPHRTLIHKKKPNQVAKSEPSTSDYKDNHDEPTKCIPLTESLIIQTEQFQKAKEDRAKQFLLGFIQEDDVKEPDIDISSVVINPDDPESEIEISGG